MQLDPAPGSEAERAEFDELQRGFPEMFRRVFSRDEAPRTVVVVPSLSLEGEHLSKISGVTHYEERLLCLLMLLRLPRTQVIFVTSAAIEPDIVDYYLGLLSGVSTESARSRLTLIDCDDDSLTPLTAKLLARPDLLATIREAVRHPEAAHLSCFNATRLELSLAVQLEMPLYAPDPALDHLGSKTGGKAVLREAGVPVPDGREGLGDRVDLVDAVVDLRRARPDIDSVVIKLNDGFSGEGNAILDLDGVGRSAAGVRADVESRLESGLRCVASGETCTSFLEKVDDVGAIVEERISAGRLRSPSVQMRVTPAGDIDLVSTHDQVMGGRGGQIFEGCVFPALGEYRTQLHDAGFRVARVLRDRGVIGRFGVDFISARNGDGWQHWALEINLRKGGTTFPNLMLDFLTQGRYDASTGEYRTRSGEPRAYVASDNVAHRSFRGLGPDRLLSFASSGGHHYEHTSQWGSIFHLMGAVRSDGKLGVVSIDSDASRSKRRYQMTIRGLVAAAQTT